MSASPALAPSHTQREMGEKEGKRWGGGKRYADRERWEEKLGERQGDRKRCGERSGKRERWRERMSFTWKVLTKHLLNAHST